MPDAAGQFKGIALSVPADKWHRIFGSGATSDPSSAKDKDSHEHSGNGKDRA